MLIACNPRPLKGIIMQIYQDDEMPDHPDLAGVREIAKTYDLPDIIDGILYLTIYKDVQFKNFTREQAIRALTDEMMTRSQTAN